MHRSHQQHEEGESCENSELERRWRGSAGRNNDVLQGPLRPRKLEAIGAPGRQRSCVAESPTIPRRTVQDDMCCRECCNRDSCQNQDQLIAAQRSAVRCDASPVCFERLLASVGALLARSKLALFEEPPEDDRRRASDVNNRDDNHEAQPSLILGIAACATANRRTGWLHAARGGRIDTAHMRSLDW